MIDEAPYYRIMLVDDHPNVRHGTRSMVESDPHYRVIAEASSADEAIDLAPRVAPDLILMDVQMPGTRNGLQATKELKRLLPKTPILILSTHEKTDYVLEAIRAGAAGYMLKEAELDELLDKLNDVFEGNCTIDTDLANRLLNKLAHEQTTMPNPIAMPNPPQHPTNVQDSPLERLTDRELEVLSYVAQGASNAEIASSLYLSPYTIKGHLEHIFGKLQVSDRTQASVKALQLGILDSKGPAQ